MFLSNYAPINVKPKRGGGGGGSGIGWGFVKIPHHGQKMMVKSMVYFSSALRN